MNVPRAEGSVPAAEIIALAIRENRPGEFIQYGLAILSFVWGVGIGTYAVLAGSGLAGVVSAIAVPLLWPSLKSARLTRRENIAIRLLSIPLSHAKSEEDAARLLSDFFRNTLDKGA